MTESEWQACTDAQKMLEFLRRSTPPARRRGDHRRLWGATFLPDSDYYLPDLGRKGCLFVCACLHRSPSKQDVDLCLVFQEYEKYCDGLAPWAEVEDAWWARINREEERIAEEDRKNNSVTCVHWMGPSEYFSDPALLREEAERVAGGKNADGFTVERRIQCGFVRDIFNPFRPVAINPAWLAWNDATVRKVAQAIYDERAFDRMPILADALDESGCTNADILGHCRRPGEHVRGCWVVDLLLGKE